MRRNPVTGKTVLIIDDEFSIREMLTVALEMPGYEYIGAGSQKTHATIIDHRTNSVLCDLMMPKVSGIELTRRLNINSTTAEIPVIMLTNKSEEDNKIQGLAVSPDDYITKPLFPRKLVTRLKVV